MSESNSFESILQPTARFSIRLLQHLGQDASHAAGGGSNPQQFGQSGRDILHADAIGVACGTDAPRAQKNYWDVRIVFIRRAMSCSCGVKNIIRVGHGEDIPAASRVESIADSH